MDLLCKRYASPFLLLNEVIRNQRLNEFIFKLYEIRNEEQTYEIWLHKVDDKSYNEFKEWLGDQKQAKENSINLKATIQDSFNMINKIQPS